jgi:hypothetical protein
VVSDPSSIEGVFDDDVHPTSIVESVSSFVSMLRAPRGGVNR